MKCAPRDLAGSITATVLYMVAGGLSPASSEDFYKDKTVSIVIGSAPGGSYDAYGRLVARHLARFIPGNPVIVPRNMPGAAGVQAANFIYNVAPKDGTAIGATLNTVPLAQLLEPQKAEFKSEEFHWIGGVASLASVLATWHTSGVKTLEDAQRKEVLIGATTPGTTMEMYPLLANNLFQTKFKVITGYKGGAEINIAMERGEVEGRGGNTFLAYTFQNPDWIRDRKINFIFQMTFERDPGHTDTPTLLEYAKTKEQKQIISLMASTETIGRSFMAPPKLPPERSALLRRAFDKVVEDSSFLADAKKAQLDISPISSEKLQQLVVGMTTTPPEIVEMFRDAVQSRRD